MISYYTDLWFGFTKLLDAFYANDVILHRSALVNH